MKVFLKRLDADFAEEYALPSLLFRKVKESPTSISLHGYLERSGSGMGTFLSIFTAPPVCLIFAIVISLTCREISTATTAANMQESVAVLSTD